MKKKKRDWDGWFLVAELIEPLFYLFRLIGRGIVAIIRAILD